MSKPVVIVGAGQAGLQVALSLRQGGYGGEIVMIGHEVHLPYQRPPLSKQVLKKEWAAERCQLRHPDFYAEHGLRMRLGAAATGIDTEHARLLLDDGGSIEYKALAICTGARLNRLRVPGAELDGVHYLRTLDDATKLAAALRPGVRLAVIGAGYIGMEVASAARQLDCEVEVIEAVDQVMKRSALPEIASYLQRRHEEEGVRIHLGRTVIRLTGSGRVDGVELDDGAVVPADVVMVGVGVRPDLEWLEGAGLETGRGVRVNESCRTSVENVYAAGDVTELSHPLLEGWQVLESVQNAVSQGKIAAAGMLGNEERYEETPWFWSEQYDVRLQMAGLPRRNDRHIVRPHPDTGGFSIFALEGDVVHAVQSIHAPRDYMVGRQLIASGIPVGSRQLEDPACNIKELL